MAESHMSASGYAIESHALFERFTSTQWAVTRVGSFETLHGVLEKLQIDKYSCVLQSWVPSFLGVKTASVLQS